MNQTIIIALGSANDDLGNLTKMSKERLDLVFKTYRHNLGARLLMTGGYGDHFNTTKKPHAFYAKQYLVQKGVPASAFLPLVESTNTIEDAELSRKVLDKYLNAQIIVVTSDFHIDRAKKIFETIFPNHHFEFSSSKSDVTAERMERLLKLETESLKKFREKYKQ